MFVLPCPFGMLWSAHPNGPGAWAASRPGEKGWGWLWTAVQRTQQQGKRQPLGWEGWEPSPPLPPARPPCPGEDRSARAWAGPSHHSHTWCEKRYLQHKGSDSWWWWVSSRQATRDYYLHQGGHIFARVCLLVGQFVGSITQKLKTRFHESLIGLGPVLKYLAINFQSVD